MDTGRYSGGGGSGRSFGARLEALGRPSILLVEDDQDIRDLLVTLLRLAGVDPHPCSTAEEGLEALREGTFDLVLTDYCLPERSGGWLLQQAEQEGLIEATGALVVTAHPNPTDVSRFEVIHKPFDLDDLVNHVRRKLDMSSKPRRRSAASAVNKGTTEGGDRDDCPEPVELILYVSAHSPHSAAALENIKKVLSRVRSTKVRLTIHDLTADPSKGIEDSITFTPTLVRKRPGPRTYILGHITNPSLVLDLLGECAEL